MAGLLNQGATSKHFFAPHIVPRIEVESEEAMQKESQLIIDYESEFSSVDVNIDSTHLLFFPVCRDKHWHLHVLNTKHYRVDLLSSVRWPEVEEESVILTQRIGAILYLLGLFADINFHTISHNIVEVPQQNNGDDCGMFVLKYMQMWNGEQWCDAGDFDYGNIDVEWVRMAMYLILHENNNHRTKVLS